MNKLKILLISSALPRDTSAGEVTLYRHFSQFPELSLSIASDREVKLNNSKFIQLKPNSILTRVTQTKYYKFSHDIIQCLEPYFNYINLRNYLKNNNIDIIITVAQGVHWMAAQQMSKEFSIPLVTIFHDWWTDMSFIHQWAKKILDRKFRNLYYQSNLALCVSKGMKRELGEHPNAKILYPIPDQKSIIQCHNVTSKLEKFQLVYAGKLSQFYASQIKKIAQIFFFQNNDYNSRLQLKLFGSHPDWSNVFIEQLKATNIYQGFVSRQVLTTELQNANALLVTIPFEQESCRWAKTNFPSKLIEYCKFGKPIIIWGPNYSTAVNWAVQYQSALVVTSPSPDDLIVAVNRLSNQVSEQIRLGNKALEMSKGIFNPETIQELFVNSIYELCNKKDPKKTLIYQELFY